MICTHLNAYGKVPHAALEGKGPLLFLLSKFRGGKVPLGKSPPRNCYHSFSKFRGGKVPHEIAIIRTIAIRRCSPAFAGVRRCSPVFRRAIATLYFLIFKVLIFKVNSDYCDSPVFAGVRRCSPVFRRAIALCVYVCVYMCIGVDVCVYGCMCVCVIRICLHLCGRVYMRVYACIYLCISGYVYVCLFLYVYVPLCACMFVCMCVYVSRCVYGCMCACITFGSCSSGERSPLYNILFSKFQVKGHLGGKSPSKLQS